MRKPNWSYEIGWHPVERVCGYRGFWVEIGYNEDAANGYVWCVQCCGSGYYFKTKEECYAYCFGRGFFHRDDSLAKIRTAKEAVAYCRGRGLHRFFGNADLGGRAWQHCLKYGLCAGDHNVL